ncbi:uncharacterized protein AB675_3523 [Cyphellophora attinorum]|uniref:Uncharacterized protein n=1 Tax=Cyphellophora attinorum TaxID=1664694 RepID=A0A0N1P0D6_9EURO|nr:uncharacterized protein AB675_3523 [Phialophora attinorum]KPI39825.1 hypothetical protein AB675_3523 [Phialophora attinorum]
MGSDRKSSQSRTDKYGSGRGRSHGGSSLPTYSEDGRSRSRGRDHGSGHRSNGLSRSAHAPSAHKIKHGKGVLVEKDPSAAGAQRDARYAEESGYTKTKEQLFKTTPCTGAMYIILTLLSLETAGVIFLAVKFTAAHSKIPNRKNISNLGDAMNLIGDNTEAGAWMVGLTMYLMAWCFHAVYLVVVVGYNMMINNKGVFGFMKRMEEKNRKERIEYGEKKVREAEKIIAEFGDSGRRGGLS